jgi:hypothetical protein
METSPSPTLKSLDLEWETLCLPSDLAAWLFQPRGGYLSECLRLAANVVIGPGPERFYNELVPVVSVHVQGVHKAFFEIDHWRRRVRIPFLGELVAPLVSNAQSVQDLRAVWQDIVFPPAGTHTPRSRFLRSWKVYISRSANTGIYKRSNGQGERTTSSRGGLYLHWSFVELWNTVMSVDLRGYNYFVLWRGLKSKTDRTYVAAIYSARH